MKIHLVLVLTLLFVMTGCAHNISDKSLALVDRSITFDRLLENPEGYRGKFVVFGGKIEAAEKRAEGIRLEIRQYDLDGRELPDETAVSRGRFLAVATGSLKISICRTGRLASIAGEVVGREVLPSAGVDYVYPVISVREIHLFSFPGEDPFQTWIPDSPR